MVAEPPSSGGWRNSWRTLQRELGRLVRKQQPIVRQAHFAGPGHARAPADEAGVGNRVMRHQNGPLLTPLRRSISRRNSRSQTRHPLNRQYASSPAGSFGYIFRAAQQAGATANARSSCVPSRHRPYCSRPPSPAAPPSPPPGPGRASTPPLSAEPRVAATPARDRIPLRRPIVALAQALRRPGRDNRRQDHCPRPRRPSAF